MSFAGNSQDMPTREHLIPKARGGRGLRDNVVAACKSCNHARGCSIDGPGDHAQLRRVMYMRAAGLHAEVPSSRARHADLPNFGRGPDGERLWAPQFGIIHGPSNAAPPAKAASRAFNQEFGHHRPSGRGQVAKLPPLEGGDREFESHRPDQSPASVWVDSQRWPPKLADLGSIPS